MAEKSIEVPADVGYAWVIALASFIMQVCASGSMSGFGVFMEYYSNEIFPEENKSNVAMIGNLAPTVIGIASVVTGQLCQNFGVRFCIILGALFMAAGHVLASFGTEVWHFALTQGVMVGLGGALLYVPANVIVTEWFQKKHGLAAGIGAAGAGLGGVAFSQMNSRMLEKIGYECTLRLNGLLIFSALLLSALMIRRRETKPTENQAAGFHSSLILNGRFFWYAISCLCGGTVYLIPLYYINSHATSMGLSRIEGGYASSAINFGSGVGRIGMGFLGDKIGYMRCYLLAIALTTVTSVIWRFSTSFTMLMVFGILYGIPSGGYAGGFGPICAFIFGNKYK
ncbi:hypothetical protein DSO57_1024874 [Entomophthora muscae]|uniref:Uncharacterized protein n=1 Tax=Entomophthora muscae TaxID=34485 RepID=A0ACC2RTG2_9FUNG|nr:hypothetical protein DSO57_1024874 [Entomophthora muscae]